MSVSENDIKLNRIEEKIDLINAKMDVIIEIMQKTVRQEAETLEMLQKGIEQIMEELPAELNETIEGL